MRLWTQNLFNQEEILRMSVFRTSFEDVEKDLIKVGKTIDVVKGMDGNLGR